MRRALFLIVGLLSCAPARPDPIGGEPDRIRLIIETDAGGDPDDEQSLVRFLLYANEWDVEGIIANRPTARERENLNPERTGLGIVRDFLKAYGECYPNLVLHDPRYPRPEILWKRTVAGYEDIDDGVNLIITAVDSPDPRPLWFSNWGTDKGSAPSCLKRALDRVLRERGPAGYSAFKDRLRLSSSDAFGEHTTTIAPPWKLWVDTFRPEMDGKRWYHRFSALTAKADGFDIERDVRTDHGPLGALYPTNTTHPQKEGDTMSFLYLVPTGMNDVNEPTWGSWAGRYGLRDDVGGQNYYWANQKDEWAGTTSRDNVLARWAVDLQNDFRARLTWCAKPDRTKSYPPRMRIDGSLRRTVVSGERVELSAEGSLDPGEGRLWVEWYWYAEAGTYRGALAIDGPGTRHASFVAPVVDAPRTIHIILRGVNGCRPPLARYQRVIVTVEPAR